MNSDAANGGGNVALAYLAFGLLYPELLEPDNTEEWLNKYDARVGPFLAKMTELGMLTGSATAEGGEHDDDDDDNDDDDIFPGALLDSKCSCSLTEPRDTCEHHVPPPPPPPHQPPTTLNPHHSNTNHLTHQL